VLGHAYPLPLTLPHLLWVGHSCPNSVKQLEVDAEGSGPVEISRRFDLPESEFQERVNEHFKLTTSAIAKDSWVNRELLAVGAM